MNIDQKNEPSLDELAVVAVRLGRELERAAHAISLGGNSRDAGHASRTLQHLADREPFEARYDASLSALEGIIEADLEAEVQGSEERFFETFYDDLGQHGELRICPIYSERGEALLGVRSMFRSFMAARAATLDRVAAERAIIRLLQT